MLEVNAMCKILLASIKSILTYFAVVYCVDGITFYVAIF